MPRFTPDDWSRMRQLRRWEQFGLPKRRRKSVVIGTFNIRKLGSIENRSAEAWDFLAEICRRFDLLAVQEVMDDLTGLKHLREQLGPSYGVVVSDVTGGVFNPEQVILGKRGNTERLAFIFNWRRIRRTELASDISFDRTDIVDCLFEHREAFGARWQEHAQALAAWEVEANEARARGRRNPDRPVIRLPRFLTFIRQPHCASFEVVPRGAASPLRFKAVNAHLLYGEDPDERRWEFDALIDWLTIRAKSPERMYCPNLLMLGDCNLEFDDFALTRDAVDARLKRLNSTALKSKKAAVANFPLLTPHPKHGELRTSARLTQTYDQIAFFAHDPEWPRPEANDTAGAAGPDAYDYGVFRFTDLFAQGLHGKPYAALSLSAQRALVSRFEHEISDHLPVWVRLPIPGA